MVPKNVYFVGEKYYVLARNEAEAFLAVNEKYGYHPDEIEMVATDVLIAEEI